ncbi:MAG: 4-hydroxy-tetrahydrodipicolinate reductase [Myxococcales bacterium]|nr:4-hydroxy-tetrahydrodipicolinate reductase [Myxococcales bacterium]
MTALVCVLGASGRMGKAVIEAATGRMDVRISAAIDRAESPVIGTQVAPGLTARADLSAGLEACDVYIDFTSPEATRAAAQAATPLRRAAVIGTTGLDKDHEYAISQLAAVAPVVVAANFSLGVNMLLGLVKQAARALGSDWDAEVVETHHRSKRDAPSGTALAIARAIADGHGNDYDRVKRHSRDGDIGARPRGEIGVHSVRGGDVVGEHVVSFFGGAERIELAHRASSRSIFAAGALRAAAWAVGKPAGRYDMLDVLGLK